MIDGTLALGAALGRVSRLDDGRVHPLRVIGLQDPEFGRPEELSVAGFAANVVAV